MTDIDVLVVFCGVVGVELDAYVLVEILHMGLVRG